MEETTEVLESKRKNMPHVTDVTGFSWHGADCDSCLLRVSRWIFVPVSIFLPLSRPSSSLSFTGLALVVALGLCLRSSFPPLNPSGFALAHPLADQELNPRGCFDALSPSPLILHFQGFEYSLRS